MYMGWLWTILIGICAGWLAGQITKGRGFGVIGDLILGVVGALIGNFLFGLLGIGPTSLLGSLIAATVGAVILLAIIKKFS